jgi:inner membrane transporter RhtA
VSDRPLRNPLVRTPPWTWAVVAMLSIQLGSALAITLFPVVGPAGTAWLRLSLGAIILILLVRPRWRAIRRHNLPGLLGLGLGTGVMTTSFLAALQTLPLGTAVAIEFLGPLTVAAITGKTLKKAVWPVLALLGVVLMTEPWSGAFDAVGIGFALLAGVGWGAYIWFSQKVGSAFSGVQGLAMSLPIAAVVAGIFGVPQAWGNITGSVLVVLVILTILTPVLPFSLEMAVLKRMNKRAFGTLMAVGPAIALLIGMVVLVQIPGVLEVVGIALVITAGMATQRVAEPGEAHIPADAHRQAGS